MPRHMLSRAVHESPRKASVMTITATNGGERPCDAKCLHFDADRHDFDSASILVHPVRYVFPFPSANLPTRF